MAKSSPPRRRGNPGTPQWIRNIIYSLTGEHPEETRQKIHSRLKELLEAKSKRLGDGKLYIQVDNRNKPLSKVLPTDRTVGKIMGELGPPGELDAPWSLGASAAWRIPPEANADLLKIWRWCVVVGRVFTIREAQWVAKLRGAVSFDNLLNMAIEYSIRERVSEKLGKNNYTADLDAMLAFYDRDESPRTGDLLYHTIIRAQVLPFAIRSSEEIELWKGEYYLARIGGGASVAVEAYLNIDYNYPHTLPSYLDEVYAFCLTKLSKGPKWQELTQETKQSIAKRLFQEVAELEKERKANLEGINRGRVALTFRPSKELIEEVGYEYIPE